MDGLGRQFVVSHQLANDYLGLAAPLGTQNPHHPETSVGLDGLLAVGHGAFLGQRDYAHQQLVGDLVEVVEDDSDALLHGVAERSSDVLELSEAFLADEVTQETVEFDRPIDPDLDVLPLVVFRQVVESQQT